jgi:hypothetical protein
MVWKDSGMMCKAPQNSTYHYYFKGALKHKVLFIFNNYYKIHLHNISDIISDQQQRQSRFKGKMTLLYNFEPFLSYFSKILFRPTIYYYLNEENLILT